MHCFHKDYLNTDFFCCFKNQVCTDRGRQETIPWPQCISPLNKIKILKIKV